MAEEKLITFPHSLMLNERNKLQVSGVTDIGGYDEQNIVAVTTQGELAIKGEELRIVSMSTDTGELVVEGNISALNYSELKQQGGFFSRLFK